MANLPTTKTALSSDEMRTMYTANGWPERLAEHERAGRVYIESEPGRGLTLTKTLQKFYDADGNVVAFLILYRRQDGDRLSVRMLRDGDNIYYAPAVSGNAPR